MKARKVVLLLLVAVGAGWFAGHRSSKFHPPEEEIQKLALSVVFDDLPKTLDWLLEENGGLDFEFENGHTLLHMAVDSESTEAARVLLAHGGDPYAEDSYGDRVVDWIKNEEMWVVFEPYAKSSEVTDGFPDDVIKLLAGDRPESHRVLASFNERDLSPPMRALFAKLWAGSEIIGSDAEVFPEDRQFELELKKAPGEEAFLFKVRWGMRGLGLSGGGGSGRIENRSGFWVISESEWFDA